MKWMVYLLAFTLVACGNPLASKKTVPPGTVGQPVQIGALTLTVVRASRSQTLSGQNAPPGSAFLSVLVSMKNNGDVVLDIGSSSFTVEDDQKKTYSPRGQSPEPALTSRKLASTDEVAGLIAFEVPSASSLTLIFRPPQTEFESVRINLNP